MTRDQYRHYYKTTLETALENGDMRQTITGICWAIAEDRDQGDRLKVIRLEELFKAYREVLDENRYRGE